MNLSELIKGKTIHQVLPFLKTAMTFFTYIHSDAHTERVLHKAFAAKRFPSTTFAPGAKACIFFPASPIGLPPDVANGITVFPVKS